METLKKYWFLIVFLFGITLSSAGFGIKFWYAAKTNETKVTEHTALLEKYLKRIEALEKADTTQATATGLHLQAYAYHLRDCKSE